MQKLKEANQKKLETARKKMETVQPPRRENKTFILPSYADVLKRHIRERLNPSRPEKTEAARPNKGDGQGRGNVPSRRENTWSRSRYSQQPRYFEQRQRFFKMVPTNRYMEVQKLNYKFRRNSFTGNQTLKRKRTTTDGNSKLTKCNGSYKTDEILKRRIVNLSNIQLTKSETDLLRKGLNFCPTPSPPTIDSINKDIDAFARRLNLREYHTPENLDDITDNPGYQPTILEKLNYSEQRTYCSPSREPYLNIYIEKLRQDIIDRTADNRRFQRNNLSKRERLALDRLTNNRDIIIKPADKGGATVLLNTTDYLQEATRQLDNDMYYKRIEEDCTLEQEQMINNCIVIS